MDKKVTDCSGEKGFISVSVGPPKQLSWFEIVENKITALEDRLDTMRSKIEKLGDEIQTLQSDTQDTNNRLRLVARALDGDL